MSNGLSISGRKNTDSVFDFYETPEWATQKIVQRLIADGVLSNRDEVCEPCCGAGAIMKVLEEYFDVVSGSDIQTGDFIYGEKGIDIANIPDNSVDVSFTNPPYNLMTRKQKNGGSMLNDFLRISKSKVVLLLNIFFLSSQERKEMLENSPLKYVYIHSDRVTMFPFGEEKPQNGGTKMFAWFVWDKEYCGEPIVRWL